MSAAPILHPPHALYVHEPHPHKVQHATERHKAEIKAGGWTERFAEWLTDSVGSIQCIGLFCFIGVGSLVGFWTNNVLLAVTLGGLSSYFLQLVLLAVLQKGTNVQARRTQLMADEQFKAVMNTEHDANESRKHLIAQDKVLGDQNKVLGDQMAELLKQTGMLTTLLDRMAPPLSPSVMLNPTLTNYDRVPLTYTPLPPAMQSLTITYPGTAPTTVPPPAPAVKKPRAKRKFKPSSQEFDPPETYEDS